MASSFISVKKFADSPYSGILGYPRASTSQIRSRIAELGRLKVLSVSLAGPTTLGRLAVLGKGYVGIVVLAKRGSRQVALKIRRTDSQRGGMRREAVLLGLANSVGVGPKLFASSKNFVVMEYLDGMKVGEWVGVLNGPGSSRRLREMIRCVLEDCYRLDEIGLDHGELSSITKHVIVGESGPSLIDFESSSTERRPSNVTSVTQAIFIGSGISKKIQRIYRNPPKEEIIECLKRYKNGRTRASFETLLKVLKV